MILTKNVRLNGTWYGPAHGNADIPDDVYAELVAQAQGGESAAALFRNRMIGAITRMIDTKVMPELVELPDDERARAFAMSEDEMVARMVDDRSLLGDVSPPAPAPAQVDDVTLADDDVIVLAEGCEYLRADLVADLDALASYRSAVGPLEGDKPTADADASQAADAPPVEVPEGTIEDLLAFVNGADAGEPPVDGWRARAEAVLQVELAGPAPRKGLVEPLERALHIDDEAEDDTDEVT